MPVKHGVKKIVLILIVILVLVQLIPSTFTYIEYFKSDTQKFKAIVLLNTTHNNISVSNRGSKEISILKNIGKLYTSIGQQTHSIHSSLTNLFLKSVLTNYRSEVRQAFLNYFHGSKYKSLL